MIHIDRIQKPNILARKEKEWTEKFIASGKKRPDNSKYGHPQIKESLSSMSYHKCFYCERKLMGVPGEIDHYIEVSDPKGRVLAFKWDNLYLACVNCNNKLPNSTIPVTEALDPCKNTNDEIEEHLIFEAEIITARNNSETGLKTIRKFRLDTKLSDYLRLKQLDRFKDILLKIRENQIRNNRNEMTENEKVCLIRFAQADHQFSLMFRILLKKYGLL